MTRAFAILTVAVALPALADSRLPPPAPANATATAELRTADGDAAGSATFTQSGGMVRMSLTASGLTPGVHALHLHETGKCDGAGFKSAGGHFNPHGRKHGMKNDAGAHAGDLPNVTAGADGTAKLDTTLAGVTLETGEKHSLLDKDGAAVVIHARPDDEQTDPAGNAGDRVVCGVIKQASAPAR